MSVLGKRLHRLEEAADHASQTPPVIIRWIIRPGDMTDCATAYVRAAGKLRRFERGDAETSQAFKARIKKTAAQEGSKA